MSSLGRLVEIVSKCQVTNYLHHTPTPMVWGLVAICVCTMREVKQSLVCMSVVSLDKFEKSFDCY